MSNRFDIQSGRTGTQSSLRGLEYELASTPVLGNELTIRLARDLVRKPFMAIRRAAIIATLCRNRTVQFVDWSQKGDADRFLADVEGVSAIACSASIRDAKGTPLLINRTSARQALINNEGCLGGPPSRRNRSGKPESHSRSLSICSLDLDTPTDPFMLLGSDEKARFIDRFRRRHDEFAEILGEKWTSNTGAIEFSKLTEFLYEIYRNTIEHGASDQSNKFLPGARLVHFEKYTRNSLDSLRKMVAPSVELDSFLRRAFIPKTHQTEKIHTTTIYELSISDQGIGIDQRIRATRPDLVESVGKSANVDLVPFVVKEHWTSKLSTPGAGSGFRIALEAIRGLRGFLSIRSGKTWHYFDGTKNCSDDELCNFAVDFELSPIVGTQVQMLFPEPDAKHDFR